MARNWSISTLEGKNIRQSYKKKFLPTVEITDKKNMIDGRKLFHQLVKNNLRTYDNIRKSYIGQGDDYTNGCLTDYPYFEL